MIHGETIHSPLPQDLPWWAADHFVFFSVLYIVILILASGMGVVVLKSLKETFCKDEAKTH